MKTKTLVIPAENRRKLVKFLQVDFLALLFFEKTSHFDPDYVATIPQMETDTQQIIKALSSTETNVIRIENVIRSFHQIKSFVSLLEKIENYLVSERWKTKEDWLQKLNKEVEISPGYSNHKYLPRDKETAIMRGDLVQIINLINNSK